MIHALHIALAANWQEVAILAVAFCVVFAWAKREWDADKIREQTASDEAWHNGRTLVTRVRRGGDREKDHG